MNINEKIYIGLESNFGCSHYNPKKQQKLKTPEKKTRTTKKLKQEEIYHLSKTTIPGMER